MSLATETDRARLWCQEQKNRRAFRRLLNKQLKGNPQLRKQLEENWKPLTGVPPSC
jgi:hypothetical protein